MADNITNGGGPRVATGTHANQHNSILPEDDESEWEYEYSKTETETFYVTLDLSQADFTSRDASTTNRPGYRGGEKAERAKLYLNRRMSPSPDNSDEDGTVSRNPKPTEQPKGAADDGDDHQVQILDLDSENPIISYKGRVYSGQWSQNVGTELLMAKRDDNNPLPALRHLDHDVDLLAASCARINVKEMQLKPKDVSPGRKQNTDASRERRDYHPLVPPAEKWAPKERVAQGDFLEKFIALKKRMGEADEVTVFAKSLDPRPNRNQRRKQKQGHRGKYNLPHPRGPRRARAARDAGILKTLSIREGSATRSATPSVAESAISTPTPLHWDDLEEDGGEEETVMDDINEEGNGEDEEMDKNDYFGSGGDGDSAEDMDVDEME